MHMHACRVCTPFVRLHHLHVQSQVVHIKSQPIYRHERDRSVVTGPSRRRLDVRPNRRRAAAHSGLGNNKLSAKAASAHLVCDAQSGHLREKKMHTHLDRPSCHVTATESIRSAMLARTERCVAPCVSVTCYVSGSSAQTLKICFPPNLRDQLITLG
jgi:hypothetical protein